MEVKILTEKEKQDHNTYNRNSLLQKWEWGNFKKQNGWKPQRLGVFENKKLTYSIQIAKKQLPFGFSIFYSSYPYIKNEKTLKAVIDKLKKIAKKEKTIFFTIEPFEKSDKKKKGILKKFGFKKSFDHFQPENTQFINLEKDEGKILGEMKQKGRYNIRLSQKKEVEVKEIKNEENFTEYKEIHEETTKRDRISARPFSYLKKLFHFLKENNLGTAYIAYYHNKPIAGSIISLTDQNATYMYGASSNTYRNVMAPYLIQWEAIIDTKKKGAKTYDFYGIAPSNNEKHKWHGITRFKKQFGGEQLDFIGAHDLVFKPFLYNIFKIIQKVRKLFV